MIVIYGCIRNFIEFSNQPEKELYDDNYSEH